jgi:tRNA-specific 2-thiouridylase
MSGEKVVVAMSGGVDSSVAAALLKEQGYDVIGITMQVWPSKKSFGGCCSLEAVSDAKKVADKLSIPHYVLNFRDVFQKDVIDNFVEEYKQGRTPNPCIRCNQFIKFDHLHRKARELGAEFVATGHYARIKSEILNPKSETNPKFQLLKGKDKKKDQAYVLYMMNQKSLGETLFPLGDLTKQEVRKLAKRYDLPVAEKEEPGRILDKMGNIVGQHDGIAFYTLGQRKGIGSHKGNPKYVVGIDRVRNVIIIGDQDDTLGKELKADQVMYVSGTTPDKPLKIKAKIRYNSREEAAVLEPTSDSKAKVVFEKSQRSITPGQSVVFYKGDEVIGGGIIS